MSDVKVDRQGRLVIPQRERERLGLTDGGTLRLTPTAEGLVLERPQAAEVRQDDTGVPVVRILHGEEVSNDDALAAIHEHRRRG
jgi:AbrB family looped-hinge helix DNA binding protein